MEQAHGSSAPVSFCEQALEQEHCLEGSGSAKYALIELLAKLLSSPGVCDTDWEME